MDNRLAYRGGKSSYMEIRQLTFLRFIAATGVIVFHFGRDTSLAFGQPLWAQANTAVSFFFVLSGFILACVYSARGVRRAADFYVARLARIGPLYWLALMAIALYRLSKHALQPAEVALSAPLVQAWWPGYSQVLNAPGWSLSVELFFYLCFPFLLRPLVQMRSRGLLALAGAVWALNLALHVALVGAIGGAHQQALRELAYYHPLTHLGTFVVGLAGGLIFLRHRETLRQHARCLIAGSLALFLAVVLIPNPIVQYHHNGLFAPLFVAFIWGLGSAPDLGVARLFSWSPLVLLGEASYGIYILQGPVGLVHAPLARRLALSADASFASYYLLLVAVSIASFKWIEIPLRERIKGAYTAWSSRARRPVPARAQAPAPARAPAWRAEDEAA